MTIVPEGENVLSFLAFFRSRLQSDENPSLLFLTIHLTNKKYHWREEEKRENTLIFFSLTFSQVIIPNISKRLFIRILTFVIVGYYSPLILLLVS